jgi:hypothetical protein
VTLPVQLVGDRSEWIACGPALLHHRQDLLFGLEAVEGPLVAVDPVAVRLGPGPLSSRTLGTQRCPCPGGRQGAFKLRHGVEDPASEHGSWIVGVRALTGGADDPCAGPRRLPLDQDC